MITFLSGVFIGFLLGLVYMALLIIGKEGDR
jgi:hypothetical protein